MPTSLANVFRVPLLKEAMPQLRRIAALANPTHVAYQRLVKELEGVAKGLGLQLQVVDARVQAIELCQATA
jgi:ABC-type uncharacterized transport system substrate-binding protein